MAAVAFTWNEPRPVEEYLEARRLAGMPHGKQVAERIKKMNPDGVLIGGRPRGIHYTSNLRHDRLFWKICGVREFDARWGKGAHRCLSTQSFVSRGGKRRGILEEAYVQGPPYMRRVT